ncbi:MAG: DNA-processing protein DprA [Candidatus Zixiibacteriota bacterium]|nr:MAG: DNA-processing protein DprA [candidate division Zixibacteria bacterium]
MTNSELKERLIDTIALLAVPGVGCGRYRRLVEKLGSPANVLSASKSTLEAVPDIGHATASAIKTEYDGESARQIAARIIQLGWTVLFPGEDGYPRLLETLPDRPAVLFRIGEAIPSDEKIIAIVGTRHATEKGRLFTSRIAGDLARSGLVIASGMAEGIDSAAHRGAIDAGGKTIAVWGTSLDIIYPPSNKSLAGEIRQGGAVYSEYLPGTSPERTTFPERNRIISGISAGVVVVEAGFRSGALITAKCALDQGRELFAVPGRPGVDNSEGTNALIKKGATLLTSAEDIFDQLPRLRGEVSSKKFKAMTDMTDMERKMIGLLEDGPQQIDQLSRKAALPVSELLGFMLALEMKGIVQELSGKRFILAE